MGAFIFLGCAVGEFWGFLGSFALKFIMLIKT
jgi:hypothetical protein